MATDTKTLGTEWDGCDQNYKNTNWIGAGYDILTMNPLDLTEHAKPSVFEQIATPHSPHIYGINTGKGDYEKMSSFSSLSVQTSSSVKVSDGFEIPGVLSFTNSNTFTSLQSNDETSSKVIVRFRTSRVKYEGELSLKDPELRLSELFLTAVTRLPDDFIASDDSIFSYLALIRDNGTHFAKRVSMGGAASLTKIVEESELNMLRQQGVDIEAGLKGTYKSLTANVGVSDKDENTTKTKQTLKIETTSMQYIGGITSIADFDNYEASVDKLPEPLDVDVMPIFELLNPDYGFFNGVLDEDTLRKKQSQLKLAVEYYLFTNGVPTLDWLNSSNKLLTLYPHYHVYHNDQHTYWDPRMCPVMAFRDPGPNLVPYDPPDYVHYCTSPAQNAEPITRFYTPVALSFASEAVHEFQSTDRRDDNRRLMTLSQKPGWEATWSAYDANPRKYGAVPERIGFWRDAGPSFNSLRTPRYRPGGEHPVDSYPVPGGNNFRIYTFGGPRRFPRGVTWETPTVTLTFQEDGAVILADTNNKDRRRVLSGPTAATELRFEIDGNIATYDADNNQIWETGEHCDRPSIMFLIGDKELTVWGDPVSDEEEPDPAKKAKKRRIYQCAPAS